MDPAIVVMASPVASHSCTLYHYSTWCECGKGKTTCTLNTKEISDCCQKKQGTLFIAH